MWQCKACQAEVEDDTWEVCWRCSTERNLSGDQLQKRQKNVAEKMAPDPELKCLRCASDMQYTGTKCFQESGSQAPGNSWLNSLANLLTSRYYFDIYACTRCGKVEFFLDGTGEPLRGEPPGA